MECVPGSVPLGAMSQGLSLLGSHTRVTEVTCPSGWIKVQFTSLIGVMTAMTTMGDSTVDVLSQ